MYIISCQENAEQKLAENLKENALEAFESKEYGSTIESAKEALRMYTNINDTLGIIESNYLISRASALSGDFNNAVQYGEAGSELCILIINYQMEYQLNNTLSWAYAILGKNLSHILDHHKRQIFVVQQLEDESAMALVYNNYGYNATVAGDIPISEAVEYMQFANDYYAKTENNNGRWYTLMNLAWQHRLVNELSKSEEFARKSVNQAEIDNDRHAIIEANTALGETLLLRNKLDEARAFYERGLELSLQQEDRDKYVFDVYHARFLWLTGQKKEAITSLTNAIEFLSDSEIFYEMLGRAFLAEYSYAIKDMDEAQKQLTAFENPRASYFSQESRVIVSCVKAQLLRDENRDEAIDILEKQMLDLEKSGAVLLQIKIANLIKEI